MLEVIAEQRDTQEVFAASSRDGLDAQAIVILSESYFKPKAQTQYVALLFHTSEFEPEPQCDLDGRIHFRVASPSLLQMYQDVDMFFFCN